MKNPRFSIVVPSFNQGQYIEETIVSIISQDYNNKELIVIDGGSTDNTCDILRKYDKNIDYWVSEPDKGTYDANNKGLSRITGDYWCIVNSDDILRPDSLAIVAEAINETLAKWLSGGVDLMDENSNTRVSIKIDQPTKTTGGLIFATRNWIYHPSTFIHRSILDQVGFFNETDIMDYEYWIRMELAGFFPVTIDKVLSGLRFHQSCKSWDYIEMFHKNSILLNEISKKVDNKEKAEMIARSNEWLYEMHVAKYRQAIMSKQIIKVIKTALILIMDDPRIVTKRWFWATLKRYNTGLVPHEYHPYHFMMDEG